MSILFKGDNKALISSITALLALDAKGALSPHGIGKMARDLLETCAARLPVEHHQGEQVAPKSCDEANQANGPTFMGEPNPHHSIEWYREGISKHWKTICDQRLTIERLTASLKFYADRDHYSTDDGLNWDSCSGEPANILWHESEPWFIEDGSIARAALTTSAEPSALKCSYCGDTGQIMVGRSGQAEDGNAPIMEPCEDRDRGMPGLASRPEERGTPEKEPCSGCGTPGWTGACNKCIPY